MSQLGQKRKCRRFQVMSALPHKADINSRDRDVRFVPKPVKLTTRICFPLCPRERTSRIAVGMSVSCQEETLALQQTAPSLDHPVGPSK
jgi:hypothetical protein